MTQDDRVRVDLGLRHARLAAYPPGEFVGQESFMRASEILSLATRAGVAPGVSVLDLCCGVAGPGRFIARELGCTYLGVDLSSSAIDIARGRAGHGGCHFEIAQVPPLPAGRFEVVLLLETMLAFPDKQALVHDVSAALAAGGRFACTVEVGRPLTAAERARMPAADTVSLVPLPDLLGLLEQAGLRVRWKDECSQAHRAVAEALLDAFAAEEPAIVALLGRRAYDDLLAAHRLWSAWLRSGRARKFALVAERT